MLSLGKRADSPTSPDGSAEAFGLRPDRAVGGCKDASSSFPPDLGRELMAEPATLTTGGGVEARGVEIAASDLWQTVKGGRQVLQGVSFTVNACELVAVVGGSGAGKTTLLEALAGVRPAERGEVRFDGVDLYENFDSFRRLLGYVPQDDIIHAELPLERTLRYAAALRLPQSRSS